MEKFSKFDELRALTPRWLLDWEYFRDVDLDRLREEQPSYEAKHAEDAKKSSQRALGKFGEPERRGCRIEHYRGNGHTGADDGGRLVDGRGKLNTSCKRVLNNTRTLS